MLLQGKHGIIFGVANQYSLAWRIAQRCAQHGASLALTYQNERFEDKVNTLAAELPDAFTLQCDQKIPPTLAIQEVAQDRKP